MCGLAGFFRGSGAEDNLHYQWLDQMGRSIFHRGPDAGSHYLDSGIAITHRRLSILDLSELGTQPMRSSTGRYVIAYNGEIYNFQEIRKGLESQGVMFKTHTDTEVLLELYEREGHKCLDRLNGMFAIAIWDTLEKELFLARDRLGKKPLYFYNYAGNFAFGSEIKALMRLPFFVKKINHEAVKDFFAYQYIPDPKTVFENLYKLPPGYWLKTDGIYVKQFQYWDVRFDHVLPNKIDDIRHGLYELIDDATKLRMISDVPLGAFLSGGVDSSAIVGLMSKSVDSPVKTCAIGFDSRKFDEVKYAQQIATLFGTEHYEFTVKESVSDNLVDIAKFFDEPFADPSFVPTYFVSQLARKEVTVALAGDGGDENFAGYSKYRIDDVENRMRSIIPGVIRHHLFPVFSSILGRINHSLSRKGQTLLNTMALNSDYAFYMTNCFFRPSLWERLVKGELASETRSYDPGDITCKYYNKAAAEDHLSKILYTDIKMYLPGDILVKVDRMSMANSLETRAPLLDYRVVEYAASIPAALKLKGKEKKYILKESFSNLLPKDILYRKKMGFSVPLSDWMRNEIYPIANQAFSSDQGGLANCFDMKEVRRIWSQHMSGHSHHTQELWSMLAFELWWKEYNMDT